MVTFDELYKLLPADGWLSIAEAELLVQVVGPYRIGLEVGCYYGRSTVLLASMLDRLYCVDPFDGFCELPGDEIYVKWQENLLSRSFAIGDGIEVQPNERAKVWMFHQRIEDWYSLPVELAYLDGDHTYKGTLAQIQKAQEAGARCIAIHDVNDDGGGLEVKRAALELLGPWTVRVERLAVWM